MTHFRIWLLIPELLFALCGVASGQCPPGQICPLQPQFGGSYSYAQPLVQMPRTSSAPPQVVRIYNTRGNVSDIGSGTLVDKNEKHGLVLSCGHLFSDGTGTITVIFPSGTKYGAKLLERDGSADLSALLIQSPEADPWEVATQAPRQGDSVYSAGFGQQGSYAVNAGTVRGYTDIQTMRGGLFIKDALQISGRARQGDSGGPMFDRDHKLVGVISVTSESDVSGTCCLRIRRFLDRHSKRFSQPANPPANDWRPAQPDAEKFDAEPVKPTVDPRIADFEKQLADAAAARKELEDKLAAEQQAVGLTSEAADKEQKTLRDKLKEAEARAADALAKVHDAAAESGKSGVPAIEQGVKTVAVGGLTGLLVPMLGPAAPIAANILVGLGGAAVLWGGNKIRKRLGSQSNSGPPYLTPADLAAGPAISAPVMVATKTIREPAPPAPLSVEERHHNHYVEIPISKTDEAWARAHAVYANAYPGSFHALKAVERLKDMILKGEPLPYPNP